jgi:hypothetical protein
VLVPAVERSLVAHAKALAAVCADHRHPQHDAPDHNGRIQLLPSPR